MKLRCAIKTDLCAFDHHRKKIVTLGDPLAEIGSYIDLTALASEVDRIAPHPVSPQSGRRPYPMMVRILILKRLYNLSDKQLEYQLLDCMSYRRFCRLGNATKISDRTSVCTFENRIDEEGIKALFDGISAQLLQKGFIARCGHRRAHGAAQAAKQRGRESLDRERDDAGRLEARQAAPYESPCHLDQEARRATSATSSPSTLT